MLIRRRVGRGHGEPEVADLDGAVIAGDEDVLGLNIPVDDAAVVHLVGARQQLPHDGSHRALRELRVAAAPVEVVVEARPVDALHDEAEARRARVADDAVEADDERAVAARLVEARLAHRVLREAAVGVGQGEAFDGDGLARDAVAPLDDRAEVARAEAGQLLVVLGAAHGEAPPLAARSYGGGGSAGAGGGALHISIGCGIVGTWKGDERRGSSGMALPSYLLWSWEAAVVGMPDCCWKTATNSQVGFFLCRKRFREGLRQTEAVCKKIMKQAASRFVLGSCGTKASEVSIFIMHLCFFCFLFMF